MSKYRLLLLALFSNLFLFSQQASSVITYGVKFDYKKIDSTPESGSEMFEKSLKEFNKIEYSLIANKNESIFELKNGLSSVEDFYLRLAKRIAGTSTYYLNIKYNELLIYRDFIGDKFLISSVILTDWKVTKESKSVDGYQCFKAIAHIDADEINIQDITVAAWFTPSIPIPFGPKGYGGLPGLILELSENRLTYFATNINLNLKKELSVSIPKEGIKISSQEFDKYVLEKIEEYGFDKKRKNN
jgi:GLPGLI family protein